MPLSQLRDLSIAGCEVQGAQFVHDHCLVNARSFGGLSLVVDGIGNPP